MLIINSQNFSAMRNMMEKARQRAKESENKYATERFVVLGDDVFGKFSETFGIQKPSYYGNVSELKNNSKIAQVVTGYFAMFYVDGRDMREGFDRGYRQNVVIADGELLLVFFHRNSPADFVFLDDMRDYYHKLPYKWEDNNPAPNKCSVLTDKKVQAWLDWLRLRRKTYDDIIEKEGNEISAFLSRINNLKLKGCKMDVTDTHGRIVKNNIRFTYKIEDGYIRQTIEVDNAHGDDKLTDFVKMALGQYD